MHFVKRVVVALSLTAGMQAPAAWAESLGDALISAYKNSNLLDQNEALLRAADEGVAAAVAQLRPIVQFVANATTDRTLYADGRSFDNNWSDLTATYAIVAQATLYDFGRNAIGVESAKETVLATREALLQIEQQVLLSAVRAYIQVRVNQEVVAIRENNVRLLSEELKATQDRFEVGEVTRTDVALAEAQLAQAQAGLSSAEGDLLVAREAYKAAVGHYPGELDRTPPMPQTASSQADAEAVALRTHPAVRQAQREATVARLAVEGARAELGPELVGTLRLGGSEFTAANDDADLNFDGGSATFNFEFNQTLYGGGGLSAAYRAALAQLDAADSNLLQVGVEIKQDVGDAWSQLSVSGANIAATVKQVDAAQIAFEGMREEANLGARTTIDVLDAEQDLLDARFARLQAEAERYVAAYNLLASMGLLTVDHLKLNVPVYDPAAYYNAVRRAPTSSPQGKKLDRILKTIQQP
ncbi:TolC family outer membrane protein [Neotabrizicola shimadae]|uniref:TolC family outer membrane protein n=1 Tax=Neotabrizicola shimadae TaxID=2807096 RepID=A0A8G0ZZ22_9RHOB|nr:TolC family outer membrane protein [Neotabrizicola shimadae]QYZ71573.1 TolC family outer membrane protein [Neotabrizicola shimadae]